MTTPGRYTSSDSSFGRSAGSAAARGGILVGIAVVVGFLLLWLGGVGGSDDVTVAATGDTEVTEETEETEAAVTGDVEADTAAAEGTTDETATEEDLGFDEGTEDTGVDTTDEANADDGDIVDNGGIDTETTDTVADTGPRSPNEVRAAVANGTGTAGLAGSRSGVLSTAGYTTDAVNTANDTAISNVYYIEGYEAEAEAVSVLLGGDASILRVATEAQLASLVAEDDQATVAGFHVLVVLGTDGRLS